MRRAPLKFSSSLNASTFACAEVTQELPRTEDLFMSSQILRRQRAAQLSCYGVQDCVHNFCMRIRFYACCIGNVAEAARALTGALNYRIAAFIRHEHEFICLEADDSNKDEIKSSDSGSGGAHFKTSIVVNGQSYHEYVHILATHAKWLSYCADRP